MKRDISDFKFEISDFRFDEESGVDGALLHSRDRIGNYNSRREF